MIMTTRDGICAQNWIEQFRRNRQDFIESEDYYNYPTMQASPFSFRSPSFAIYHAFTWVSTPEGDDVWNDRQLDFEGDARLTR